MAITVKGNHVIRDNQYVFKTDNLLGDSYESTVEIGTNKIILRPDILGINKIYFVVSGQDVTISNRFRDFYSHKIENDFEEFQIKLGYVPYPFTILKSVRKAFPGIEHIITKKYNTGKWQINYNTLKIADFFSAGKQSGKNFKKDFLLNIEKIKSRCGKNIIVSLSGGFDSLLLARLFKEHIVGIVNYSDNAKELKSLQGRIGELIPKAPWHTYLPDIDLNTEDVDRYFDAIDEPCCDVASLANFLMLRKLIKANSDTAKCLILNGEGADSLFLRERAYFKEYLLGKIFLENRGGLNFDRLIRFDSIRGKILDYFKSTKTRFCDDYTEHLRIGNHYQQEFDYAYNLYDCALKAERANFSGILDLLLFCSNQATDKLKVAANGLDIKYLVPFYDSDMLKFALSIDARHKVGYCSGKKALTKAFMDIPKNAYTTGSPRQINLWHKVANTKTVIGYRKYYFDKWLTMQKDNAKNL